jgi:hypothetical protein
LQMSNLSSILSYSILLLAPFEPSRCIEVVTNAATSNPNAG